MGDESAVFSIIIATCDRPDRLKHALRAVAKAIEDSGHDHQILVVDNGARNSAEATVMEFAREVGKPVAYLTSETRNKSAALNAGIRSAKSEWLAFTDDDALPAVDWLRRADEYCRDTGLNIFGGKVVPRQVNDSLPRWLKPGRSRLVPKGPAIVEYAPLAVSGIIASGAMVPLGANLFVKKSVFERYGGYDECLWKRCGEAALGSEDAEFAMRVRSKGEAIGYCSEAVVVHPVLPEKATLRFHLAWALRFGLREPILFRETAGSASVAYLLRRIVLCLAGAARHAVCADPAAAVCGLMDAAQALGQMRGRRLAQVEDKMRPQMRAEKRGCEHE